MSIVMHAASLIVWLGAVTLSGAVGMLLEEGRITEAERGIWLVLCFATCAFILQVMA